MRIHFQKEKNFEETLCLQPRHASLVNTYMQITFHLLDFPGDKNVDFQFPDACLL